VNARPLAFLCTGKAVIEHIEALAAKHRESA